MGWEVSDKRSDLKQYNVILPERSQIFNFNQGNFYHHFLLATLRNPGEKAYKVPTGGLFEYVAAPHYLFEIIGWYGMAIASQHSINLLTCVGMTVYLFERATAQSEWNRKNLKDKYPLSRKHIVPFIF